MRRIAGVCPGEAETDAEDTAVIADAARATPRTPRSLEPADEITAELTVLVGFDQDLAAEATGHRRRRHLPRPRVPEAALARPSRA